MHDFGFAEFQFEIVKPRTQVNLRRVYCDMM